MNGDNEGRSAPAPISQDVIHIVLQYISQSSPLPPHLVSKPLLQRHYFLQLSPDNYLSYLVWPGSPTEDISVALSNFSPPATDQHVSYPVAYSSDPDAVLAHVCVAPMRLVFRWGDEAPTWKYHNLALMPFPSESVSTIVQLMEILDQPVEEDSYWDNSDNLDIANSHGGEQGHTANESEDDYWARYLGVQGSGDSTVPSPPRVQEGGQVAESHEEPGRVMVAYPAAQTEIYDPLRPPSPGQLARRLATLAARDRLSSVPGEVPSRSETGSPTLSPDQAHLCVIANAADPKSTVGRMEEHPCDGFVGNAIRSMYHLWKGGRPGANEEAFMSIVRQSIRAT